MEPTKPAGFGRVEWAGATEPPDARVGDEWRRTPDGARFLRTDTGWTPVVLLPTFAWDEDE